MPSLTIKIINWNQASVWWIKNSVQLAVPKVCDAAARFWRNFHPMRHWMTQLQTVFLWPLRRPPFLLRAEPAAAVSRSLLHTARSSKSKFPSNWLICQSAAHSNRLRDSPSARKRERCRDRESDRELRGTQLPAPVSVGRHLFITGVLWLWYTFKEELNAAQWQ